MGHRALLARERPDGRYDCYYAHWGGADLSLARRLAEGCEPAAAEVDDPRQPADPTADSHRSADPAADCHQPANPAADRHQPADPAADPAVDDEPIAVDASRERVFADHLDPLAHEALFVVRPCKVDAYRPLWFGPVEGSAVVAVDPYAPCDDDRVLAWFRGTRDAVADLLADGALDEETAATCLRRRVRAWADDREVVFP